MHLGKLSEHYCNKRVTQKEMHLGKLSEHYCKMNGTLAATF
jgi:hypothetical protein